MGKERYFVMTTPTLKHDIFTINVGPPSVAITLAKLKKISVEYSVNYFTEWGRFGVVYSRVHSD